MTISKLWLLALPLAIVACEDQHADTANTGNPGFQSGEDGVVVTGSRIGRSEFTSISPAEVVGGEVAREQALASQGDSAAPDDENPNFLAYSYNMAVEAPAANVAGLFQQHRDACLSAGPGICQLMNANLADQSANYVSGRLQFRASPDWLTDFRDGVAADAEAVDGRLVSENTSAEDLSATILDTRARLSTQIALRDRLQNLLATDGASVEELIRVERELARVQGDIESATSRLRYLEGRVSMSVLAISYQSAAVPINRTTINPVIAAFNDFFDIIADGLAAVIRTIAAILPWLILIIPAFWFLRVLWRRRQAKKDSS